MGASVVVVDGRRGRDRRIGHRCAHLRGMHPARRRQSPHRSSRPATQRAGRRPALRYALPAQRYSLSFHVDRHAFVGEAHVGSLVRAIVPALRRAAPRARRRCGTGRGGTARACRRPPSSANSIASPMLECPQPTWAPYSWSRYCASCSNTSAPCAMSWPLIHSAGDGREIAAERRLVIGEVHERAPVLLDPVADRRALMRHLRGADRRRADRHRLPRARRGT